MNAYIVQTFNDSIGKWTTLRYFNSYGKDEETLRKEARYCAEGQKYIFKTRIIEYMENGPSRVVWHSEKGWVVTWSDLIC